MTRVVRNGEGLVPRRRPVLAGVLLELILLFRPACRAARAEDLEEPEWRVRELAWLL